MARPVVEVQGLTMRYGALEAVRGIDLEVAAGKVFAFLGPNGAGKTTTVEILEGYRRRSDGEVLLMAVLLVALGRLLYGVSLPGATAVGFVVALVVGATAFCALGVAITAVIPTEAATPAVANAVTLPLYFVSGIFIPAESIPGWLLAGADVFPVKPFADALFTAFDPRTSGVGLSGPDLAVVAAWGVAGALVAARAFRWTPRRG